MQNIPDYQLYGIGVLNGSEKHRVRVICDFDVKLLCRRCWLKFYKSFYTGQYNSETIFEQSCPNCRYPVYVYDEDEVSKGSVVRMWDKLIAGGFKNLIDLIYDGFTLEQISELSGINIGWINLLITLYPLPNDVKVVLKEIHRIIDFSKRRITPTHRHMLYNSDSNEQVSRNMYSMAFADKHYLTWTENEDAMLKSLMSRGETISIIAQVLQRSISSVTNRMRQIRENRIPSYTYKVHEAIKNTPKYQKKFKKSCNLREELIMGQIDNLLEKLEKIITEKYESGESIESIAESLHIDKSWASQVINVPKETEEKILSAINEDVNFDIKNKECLASKLHVSLLTLNGAITRLMKDGKLAREQLWKRELLPPSLSTVKGREQEVVDFISSGIYIRVLIIFIWCKSRKFQTFNMHNF